MGNSIRQFKVSVNGREYEVKVEELQDGSAPIGMAPVSMRPPAAPAPAPTPAAGPAAAPGEVPSPMAGKILKIPVKKGQKVKAGEVLIVLEAMKMETNINAAADGEVKDILVKEGDTVETGAPLMKVE